MKYVVIVLNEREEIFLFPKTVDHDRFFEALEAIRFGDERNWNRALRGEECVAAGFVDGGLCYGRSETLGIGSRGSSDTTLLKARLV